MITQLSKPEDIDREFWADLRKAMYWLNKQGNTRDRRMKILDDGWEVFNFRQEYSMSEPIYYTSPQTGNRWLLWITAKRDKQGETHFYMRAVLYFYTAAYMTMMMALNMNSEDSEGNVVNTTKTVNVYTSHMFQRMADKDRLGVDMSDRVKVMRNFVEFVATGWSDTRPPRKGERNTQLLFRTPGSWLRGHTSQVGTRWVNVYRTFYTDKSMTPKQKKDVGTFQKFADNNKC